MLEELQSLYQSTSNLAQNLKSATANDFEKLVFQREVVLIKLKEHGNVTESEQKIISQLQSFDSLIVGRMEEIKNEAAQGLMKIRQSKLQRNSYNANYTNGSSFFDTRN